MDDLVRTAELMRERANAATPGPWSAAPPDEKCGHRVEGDNGKDWVAWTGEFGEENSAPDAGYIASMHPHVGHAVADLLDVIGEILSRRAMPDAALEVTARDVARAYLGGSHAAESSA